MLQLSVVFVLELSLSIANTDLKLPFLSPPQYFPVSEVPGSVGPGTVGRFCPGVQI